MKRTSYEIQTKCVPCVLVEVQILVAEEVPLSLVKIALSVVDKSMLILKVDEIVFLRKQMVSQIKKCYCEML